MHLRAQLTLWSVLVMAIIVGTVTVFDLAQEINNQFTFTLKLADNSKQVAEDDVNRALERNRAASIAEALRLDTQLSNELLKTMSTSKTLLEIAVCDPQGFILADSESNRIGLKFPPLPDFQELVRHSSLVQKIHVLTGAEQRYQLSEGLAVSGLGTTAMYVRVVVYPRLIEDEIIPTIQAHAKTSILSLIGTILAAFLFSTIAFRPIGKLGEMLDSVAKGEFESPETLPGAKASADEFSVVASKVNLLGQQLRGAKYDFSDLRGNFERLLDQLEDAVLMFGRDRRLVVASGAVEKFLGRMRADLVGRSLPEVFPPNTTLGLMLAQAAQTGRPIGNRRVPITRGDGSGAFVVLLSVDILEPMSAGTNPGRGTGLLVRLRDPEAARQ